MEWSTKWSTPEWSTPGCWYGVRVTYDVVALAGDHTWLTVGPCLACSALGVMSISLAPLGEVVTCLGGLPMCMGTARSRMLCGEASTDGSMICANDEMCCRARLACRAWHHAPDSQAHRLCVMSDVCEDLCGVEKRRLQQFVVHRAKKMWVGFPVLEEINHDTHSAHSHSHTR